MECGFGVIAGVAVEMCNCASLGSKASRVKTGVMLTYFVLLRVCVPLLTTGEKGQVSIIR